MSLQSMTGFARASGETAAASVTWELRSVNGKSIELRFRLPQGMERIEPLARQAVQQRFSRGNIQASLTITRAPGSQPQPVVNEAFLKDVADLAKRLEQQFGTTPASADGLLALRGVLDVPEAIETDEERAASDAAIMSVLDQALKGLEAARKTEGAALGAVLGEHVTQIEALTLRAEADPSREPAAIRLRLAEQVRLLMDVGAGLGRATPAHGSGVPGDESRHSRRDRPPEDAYRLGARAAWAGRPGRSQARFSGAGIQPRIEYIVFQIECSRSDSDRS